MKKSFIQRSCSVIMGAIMAASIVACGSEPAPATTEAPEQTEAPAAEGEEAEVASTSEVLRESFLLQYGMRARDPDFSR